MSAVAHLSRPRIGESENGDTVIVRQRGTLTLVAVVDALGHGPVAAQTAEIARVYLEQSETFDVAELLEGMHAALRGSRGAAATIAALDDDGRLQCGGVGNVSIRAAQTRFGLSLVPGVLGRKLRRVAPLTTMLPIGDRLAMWTDGLSQRLELEASLHLSAYEACAALMQQFSTPQDDATVAIIDLARAGADDHA